MIYILNQIISGHARRPTNETIQNIRKLNAEYKLGQLLCKSRNPDFLLALIKRQVIYSFKIKLN